MTEKSQLADVVIADTVPNGSRAIRKLPRVLTTSDDLAQILTLASEIALGLR